jgi:hypothetical protein
MVEIPSPFFLSSMASDRSDDTCGVCIYTCHDVINWFRIKNNFLLRSLIGQSKYVVKQVLVREISWRLVYDSEIFRTDMQYTAFGRCCASVEQVVGEWKSRISGILTARMSSEKKPKKEKEIFLEFENQARGKSQILRNVDKQNECRLSGDVLV